MGCNEMGELSERDRLRSVCGVVLGMSPVSGCCLGCV